MGRTPGPPRPSPAPGLTGLSHVSFTEHRADHDATLVNTTLALSEETLGEGDACVLCAPHTGAPQEQQKAGSPRAPPRQGEQGWESLGTLGAERPGPDGPRRASWGQEAAAGPARRTVPAGPGGIGARCPSRLPARVPRGLPSHGRLGSGPHTLRTH